MPSALTGAVLDTVTTQVALNQGNIELNPIGFNVTIILKSFYFLTIRDSLTEQKKSSTDQIASAVWTGASVNNFLVVLGAVTPIAMMAGLATALVILTQPCDKQGDDNGRRKENSIKE